MKYFLLLFCLLIPQAALADDVFKIEVHRKEHTLLLYKNDQLIESYDIIVGKSGRKTPKMETYIDTIDINPTWHPTAASIREIKKHPELIEKYGVIKSNKGWYSPPSDKNPLGKARLNLHYAIRPIKIHGTSEPELFKSKRRDYSAGCIRVLEIQQLVELIVPDKIDWDKSYRIKLKKPVHVSVY